MANCSVRTLQLPVINLFCMVNLFTRCNNLKPENLAAAEAEIQIALTESKSNVL